MAPSHVLVPLDGSPLADEALVHALETFDCAITVLNVVTPVDAGMSEGGVIEVDDQREETAAERADAIIDRAKRRAEKAGRSVEQAVETGDPAETIVSYAENNDIDHIVMGSHGQESHELTRRLLGTVATAVVAQSPVSVTVVR